MGRTVAHNINLGGSHGRMTKKTISEADPEIVAISEVHNALKGLDSESQARVLRYVASKLSVQPLMAEIDLSMRRSEDQGSKDDESGGDAKHQEHDELEAISPAGRKWIIRNGFQGKQLAKVFSLADEIDLIAEAVPGTSKRERMRSVFLLKGIAAYLVSCL